MPLRPLLFRARTVVPDPWSAIDDGAVLLLGGRVARVGKFRGDLEHESARVTELGEVALLPGLVNAHAHLDLTGARGRLEPESDFAAWLGRIKPMREELRPDVAAHAEEGARELLASGCTMVGDIVAEVPALDGLRRSGIRGVAFIEVLELPRVVVRPLREALDIASRGPWSDELRPGLAPHTPYTCTPEILDRCAEAWRTRRLPVTLHIAESRHEVEFMLDGGGLFKGLLGPWLEEGWMPPGMRPLEWLQKRGFFAGPRLLAHANYLDAKERALARDHGASVVHCPGSHAFFGHDTHPVTDLLRDGVNLALGTDGLVSHPEHRLSIPGEAARLARAEPSLDPRVILAMATTGGADALGMRGLIGVLRPGAFADMAAFTVPGGWSGPSSLLDPGLRCSVAFVGGVERHRIAD
jgi:cytosine/adenosine deaminase-related metal-dependent hydrolase